MFLLNSPADRVRLVPQLLGERLVLYYRFTGKSEHSRGHLGMFPSHPSRENLAAECGLCVLVVQVSFELLNIFV